MSFIEEGPVTEKPPNKGQIRNRSRKTGFSGSECYSRVLNAVEIKVSFE